MPCVSSPPGVNSMPPSHASTQNKGATPCLKSLNRPILRPQWRPVFSTPNGRGFVFFFQKRVFVSKTRRHSQGRRRARRQLVAIRQYQYQVLSARADSLCTEFADRWGLDVDLLRARIPGLAKLAGLSVPPPTKNYARLACLGMIAIPLALFLLGVMAGLVSVGFHLVGGR